MNKGKFVRVRPVYILLGVLNFLFFQWFFVQLACKVDPLTGKVLEHGLLSWPVPLTGWWKNNYKYL